MPSTPTDITPSLSHPPMAPRKRKRDAATARLTRSLFHKKKQCRSDGIGYSKKDSVRMYEPDAPIGSGAYNDYVCSSTFADGLFGSFCSDPRRDAILEAATRINFEPSIRESSSGLEFSKIKGKKSLLSTSIDIVRVLARNGAAQVSMSECLLNLFDNILVETDKALLNVVSESEIGSYIASHKDAMAPAEWKKIWAIYSSM